jgi:methyl-accepting chemotaxis protein
MRNVTVRFTLTAALVLFSSMIVVGAAVGIFALGRANDSTTFVHEITERTLLINDAYKDTTRTRAALTRAYSALKEQNDEKVRDSALASAQTTYDRTLKQMNEFAALPALDGQDEAVKIELIESVKQLSDALKRSSDALKGGDTAAYSTINGKDITVGGQRFSAALDKYQKLAMQLNDDAVEKRQTEYKLVIWMVGIGLAVALLMVIGVQAILNNIVIKPLNRAVEFLNQVASGDLTATVKVKNSNEIGKLFLAIRSMQQSLLNTVSQVRSSSDSIDTNAREIAAGNMDLSSRTEQQASSLEETAASMEQLTGTVKQNAENAMQANQLAHSASTVAIKGGAVVAQVVDTMDAINTSSRKIVDIISVIDGIAFQTNILALNAAVEAARAGEQGRGFAVVASEVRSLAQRSASAAKEIKELIADSVEKVDAGSKLVGEAGMTMSDVVDSVKRVTDIVGEIAEASREQSSGIEQVNQAITQMDEVTQQNAALVEQAAAAAQSLQSQATNLVGAVSIFKIDATQSVAANSTNSAVGTGSGAAFKPAAPVRTAVKKPVAAATAQPARASGDTPKLASPAARSTAPASSRAKDEGQDWEEF